jgi:WWE domain
MAALKFASDAEWVDGGVEAVICTKGGHQIVWQCWIANINETMSWADFKPFESLRMEAAVAANEGTVNLTLHEDAWSIDLVKMQQTNLQTGTTRAIRRVVILKQGVLKD